MSLAYIHADSPGITGKKRGEEILEAYQEFLPLKQRDQMPSLRSWYDQLSAPVHSATSDEALFEKAKKAIVEHFDFRRIFKIPDAPPVEAKVPEVAPVVRPDAAAQVTAQSSPTKPE